ncbi:uncharacterized protein LOC141908761 isoform X2 [Tubulanus polymorphus]|uniref:uncharacterized protein LOC141908761 isoform X2 n=1 Tax=Tubulanus polymorphus TaxID=672921 RepID=UPI003DA2D06C
MKPRWVKMSLNVIIIITISCAIIPSSLQSEFVRINQHFGGVSNFAMKGPYLTEYKNLAPLNCVRSCMDKSDCSSFNYNENLCQLSSELPTDALDLEIADGNVFQYKCNGDIYCRRFDFRVFPNRCKHLVANGIAVDGAYQLYLNAGKDANYAITSKPHIHQNKRTYNMYSESYFSKIRLNLDTFHVVRNDFTFADTSKRLPVLPTNWKPTSYGDGGSCSRTNGVVRIDLSGTGFRLAPGIDWRAYGYAGRLTYKNISTDRQKVTVKCYGWCGGCSPTGALKLDRIQ